MKAFQRSSEPYGWIGLPARLMMASLFLLSGFSKLANVSAAQAYMRAYRIPELLVWPAAFWELAAGLLLILGLWTRPIAVLLAGWSLLTAAIFHKAFSDQNQLINFLKNVVIAGAFLSIAVTGIPGWSLKTRVGAADQARASS